MYQFFFFFLPVHPLGSGKLHYKQVCILREELDNPSQALIGGLCRGDVISQPWIEGKIIQTLLEGWPSTCSESGRSPRTSWGSIKRVNCFRTGPQQCWYSLWAMFETTEHVTHVVRLSSKCLGILFAFMLFRAFYITYAFIIFFTLTV